MCLDGASRAGAGLLRSLPHPDLRLFYVWLPMLPPDSAGAAEEAALRFAEDRAAHYWDRERHLGRSLARALGITAKDSLATEGRIGIAWDIYLAYGRGPLELERPAFWMHQLGATHAPRLDAEEWRRRVEALLRTPQDRPGLLL